jgi:ABC-type multidrug transport system ATPase subunit
LLDDPLSAFDPEVCGKIFNECIKGIFADKTVILATHQAHFALKADKILILDAGKQVFFGTYEELVERKMAFYLGEIAKTNHEEPEEQAEEIKTKGCGEEEEKEEEMAFNRIRTMKTIKDIESILDEENAKGRVPIRFI